MGKTTTARLIAQAINCKKNFVQGEKCNPKEYCSCKEINEFRNLDVVEIDGAQEWHDSYSGITIIPGKHTIKVSKEGYFDHEEAVTVESGKTVQIKYELKKNIGYLQLNIEDL